MTMEFGQKPMGKNLPKAADELGREPQERPRSHESQIMWPTPLCLFKLDILKRIGFA